LNDILESKHLFRNKKIIGEKNDEKIVFIVNKKRSSQFYFWDDLICVIYPSGFAWFPTGFHGISCHRFPGKLINDQL